jgi:hypothetical protein
MFFMASSDLLQRTVRCFAQVNLLFKQIEFTLSEACDNGMSVALDSKGATPWDSL